MEAGFCSTYRNAAHVSNVTTQKTDNEELEKYVSSAIYIILILLIIPGNFSVIFYMWKKKQFSTNFSVYATSLAVTDLTVGVFVLPLELANLPDWIMNVPLCVFVNLIAFVPTSVSIFLLDVVAYDRYVCVTSPLLYRSHFTRKRSVILSITMWIMGFLIWIPYFVGQQYDDVYNVTFTRSCLSNFGYFTLGQAVLAYYIPTIFLVVMYILLQRALSKRTIISEFKLQARRNIYMIDEESNQVDNIGGFTKAEVKSEHVRDKIGNDQGVKRTIDRPVTPGTFSAAVEPCRLPVKSHQTTISVERLPRLVTGNPRRTNSRKYPQIGVQNRACLRTVIVVVIAFLLCWAPRFILWPMTKQCDFESRAFHLVYTVFSILAFANSAFNPFIYVLSNQTMRYEIMNFFKRH